MELILTSVYFKPLSFCRFFTLSSNGLKVKFLDLFPLPNYTDPKMGVWGSTEYTSLINLVSEHWGFYKIITHFHGLAVYFSLQDNQTGHGPKPGVWIGTCVKKLLQSRKIDKSSKRCTDTTVKAVSLQKPKDLTAHFLTWRVPLSVRGLRVLHSQKPSLTLALGKSSSPCS